MPLSTGDTQTKMPFSHLTKRKTKLTELTFLSAFRRWCSRTRRRCTWGRCAPSPCGGACQRRPAAQLAVRQGWRRRSCGEPCRRTSGGGNDGRHRRRRWRWWQIGAGGQRHRGFSGRWLRRSSRSSRPGCTARSPCCNKSDMSVKGSGEEQLSQLDALPESGSLPSVRRFAEWFLSGTRQRRICRVPHSAKSCSR
jgi:hypothetical protein